MKKIVIGIFLLLCGHRGADAQVLAAIQSIQRLESAGFAQGPVLSPDGLKIAFSRENYNGVFILDLETGGIVQVCPHLGSGWGMIWLDEARLIVRSTSDGATPRQRGMGLELIDVRSKVESPLIPFSPENRIEVPQRTSLGTVLIRNRGAASVIDLSSPERRLLSQLKGEPAWSHDGRKIVYGRSSFLPPGERTILSAVWSPNGSHALVEVLGQPSLYLFTRATARFEIAAEKGERPSWLDDDVFIYQETYDDGHAIIGGDIFLASRTARTRQNLTAHFDKIALNPSVSRDGKIAFNTAEGDLYLLRIDVR